MYSNWWEVKELFTSPDGGSDGDTISTINQAKNIIQQETEDTFDRIDLGKDR